MTDMHDSFYLTVKKMASNLIKAGAVLVSRFFSLLPNFSLVGSFGFFQANPVYYFAQLIIFDLFFGGYYRGWLFTYLGFGAYWVLGRLAGAKIARQITFLPIASLIFYLLSNLGVWWYWYPRTTAGLVSCYTLAVPFYRNTLLGDLFFGGMVIAIKAVSNLSNQHLNRVNHANITQS